MQVKLLRVLQERTIRPLGGAVDVPVDVRLIASTNRDLKRMVAEGQFREDFFYRISVIPVHVPPLREREEDVELLARHFLRRYAAKMAKGLRDIDQGALTVLNSYSWPGNVRELENAIERAVALSKEDEAVLKLDSLPESLRGGGAGAFVRAAGNLVVEIPTGGIDFEGQVAQVEKQYLAAALQAGGGVRRRAADLLRMSYRSFRHYAKKYNI
jgi:two-component system response regulator PilR (NtrC family)